MQILAILDKMDEEGVIMRSVEDGQVSWFLLWCCFPFFFFYVNIWTFFSLLFFFKNGGKLIFSFQTYNYLYSKRMDQKNNSILAQMYLIEGSIDD